MGIHKYRLKDKYILLDINTSVVFEIDKLIFDLLDHYPSKSQSEVLSLLKSFYPLKQLKEGIEEIDQLICSGVLFTKDESLMEDSPIFGTLKSMCLHVAHDCNMSCMYCFASGGDFNTKKELMSIEVAKSAIDYLIENSHGRKNLEVDFFGGEPLLNFDVVKETVLYAKSLENKYNKNFRFTITTNCINLNEEIMDFVNHHMTNIVMSLDGRKAVNDIARKTLNGKSSYDIIVDKIKHAVKSRGNKDYFVRGTYTANNLDFSQDVRHMAELGFKNTSIEPVVADDSQKYAIKEEHLPQIFNEYEKLTDLYLEYRPTENEFSFFHFNIDLDNSSCKFKKESGCGAGSDYIAVSPRGEIYPCHQFVGEEIFKLGTVDQGIAKYDIVDKFKETTISKKQHCQQCWAKYFCGGGCYANAYHFSGQIDGCYEIGCALQKKRIECALYLKAIEVDR